MVRVLDRLDVKPRPLHVYTTLRDREERPSHDLRQLLQQHGLRRAGVYAPATRGEADGHAGLDILRFDDHRGAGENDLGGPLYLDPPAPARAPVPAHDAPDPPLDAPGKEVLEGDPAHRIFEDVRIERVLSQSDTDQGGRGEGITLHPVYEQGERSKVVRAGEVFVGTVSLAIYALERCPEALHLYPRR